MKAGKWERFSASPPPPPFVGWETVVVVAVVVGVAFDDNIEDDWQLHRATDDEDNNDGERG